MDRNQLRQKIVIEGIKHFVYWKYLNKYYYYSYNNNNNNNYYYYYYFLKYEQVFITKKYHVFAPMGSFIINIIAGTTVENKGKLILNEP